jgi:hypothetical protein
LVSSDGAHAGNQQNNVPSSYCRVISKLRVDGLQLPIRSFSLTRYHHDSSFTKSPHMCMRNVRKIIFLLFKLDGSTRGMPVGQELLYIFSFAMYSYNKYAFHIPIWHLMVRWIVLATLFSNHCLFVHLLSTCFEVFLRLSFGHFWNHISLPVFQELRSLVLAHSLE